MNPAQSSMIANLLRPFDVDTFEHDHWQRKELLIKRGDPQFYSDIISLDEIDRILSESAIPKDNIDMGQNAVGIPKEHYSNGRFIRAHKVMEFHQAGETIIFRGAHNWFPKLMALCNEISSHFHCRVQTNLYLTPANTQSSYPHWDAHDIFVLQVCGNKIWKLHEDRLQRPLPRYEFAPGRYEVGPETGEMNISAGDFAYVPRGLIHNPVANEYSIHVAVGLPVVTWVDVLERLVARSGDELVALREAIPTVLGDDRFELETASRMFAGVAQLAMNAELVSDVLKDLSDEILRNRRPRLRHRLSHFVKPRELRPGAIIAVRPDVRTSMVRKSDAINVSFNDTILEFPADLEPELENILLRRRLRVSEVSRRSLTSGTAVSEALLENGCIEVVFAGD